MEEWRAVMTRAEFVRWIEFYRMQPFDDRHRYHRPAALVAHVMGGADVAKLVEWLEPEPIPDGYTANDVKTAAAFGFKLS